MKNLLISIVVLLTISCATGSVAPPVIPPTPLGTIQLKAKNVLDQANALSAMSETAYDVIKAAIGTTDAKSLAIAGNLVDIYNCALIDPSLDATATALCTQHGAPMLGLVKKLLVAVDTASLSSASSAIYKFASDLVTQLNTIPAMVKYMTVTIGGVQVSAADILLSIKTLGGF